MDLVLTTADLNLTVNHEPRVLDLRLAEALGFADTYKIRDLIKRNMEALQRFGEVSARQRKPGKTGGRPGVEYFLNKRQALYITAKSDTDRAADVTVRMVEVFDEHLREAAQPMLPAPGLDRAGLALLRIGGKVVTVDTKRFKVGPKDRVVRIHFDGHIDVGTVIDGVSNWFGARGGRETPRRPRRGDPASATKMSSTVQVLGVVIDEGSLAKH